MIYRCWWNLQGWSCGKPPPLWFSNSLGSCSMSVRVGMPVSTCIIMHHSFHYLKSANTRNFTGLQTEENDCHVKEEHEGVFATQKMLELSSGQRRMARSKWTGVVYLWWAGLSQIHTGMLSVSSRLSMVTALLPINATHPHFQRQGNTASVLFLDVSHSLSTETSSSLPSYSSTQVCGGFYRNMQIRFIFIWKEHFNLHGTNAC